MYSQLIFRTGTYCSPTFTDLLPNGIHLVPMLWIFLTQPLPLRRARDDKIEPQSRAITVSAGVDHVMVNIEFFYYGVPVPGFLEPELIQRPQKLIDDPLLHELLK